MGYSLKKFRGKTERGEETLQLMPLGFHGDNYLIQITDFLISEGVTSFVETGSNVGSTLSFFAKKYPDIQCFSCEPDIQAYGKAKENVAEFNNVKIFNMSSQEFIKEISRHYAFLFEEKVFFWLDAHGYGFHWPLKEEIRFISTFFKDALILIDDFKVPDRDVFEYDVYEGQECSMEYIKSDIADVDYTLYYPNYTEKTSAYHPLRGWGLMVIGQPIDFAVSGINKFVRQVRDEDIRQY